MLPSDYGLSAYDPEAYVAIAVDDLLRNTDVIRNTRDLGHKGCGMWVTNPKTNLLYTFPLSVVQQMLLELLPHLPCKSYRTKYRSLEEL